MELQIIDNHEPEIQEELKPFIEANTVPMTLQELTTDHIIPVFTRNNQPLISQAQFIDLTREMVTDFSNLPCSLPEIRVSHPIKGRIPSAKHKKAAELEAHEKTLYYERCMFIFRLPELSKQVNGQQLDLIVGGVKAYNLDKINGHRESLQHFKIFIGYQVKVCSNLCIWTDGAILDVKISSMNHLALHFKQMFEGYDPGEQIDQLNMLQEVYITEKQFAQMIGRCRMYPHLPTSMKKTIPRLSLSDSQISRVVNGYYKDNVFGGNGGIDLWSLYNLFTSANKSSYLDTVVDKNVSAGDFVSTLVQVLEDESDFWYLN
jgi:hypothetical protein